MKFLINSNCLIGGIHTAAGSVVSVTFDQATELLLANRGQVVADSYTAPGEAPAAEPEPMPEDPAKVTKNSKK